MQKITRAVLLPDIHYPHHNKDSFKAVLQFMKEFKPNVVVLMGDAMNMDSVNHWKKKNGNQKYFEGKRLLREYNGFDKEILKEIEKNSPPTCKKIFLGGNHEEWAKQVVEKNPQLEGMVEPEIALNLKERSWKWIPYLQEDAHGNTFMGKYVIGKLILKHGESTGIHHAKKMSEINPKSVVYGHTHDVQMFTNTNGDPADYHTAQSIGCLCKTSPEYMKGRANRWVNSFGILYTRRGGLFNLYSPIIVNGQFVYNGKIYGGAK